MQLYRYRPFHSQFLKDEIQSGLVFHWPMTEQNDPFEGFFRYGGRVNQIRAYQYLVRVTEALRGKKLVKDKTWLTGLSPEQIDGFLRSLESLRPSDLWRMAERYVEKAAIEPDRCPSPVRELHSRMLGRTQISCFSMKGNSSAMFAHYGRNHTGVCIWYEGASERLFKVRYKKKPAILDVFETGLDEMFEARVLTKHIEWKNEEEVRHVVYDEDPGLKQVQGLSITDVTLGVCMDSDSTAQVIGMVQASIYSDIRVWKPHKSSSNYGFDMERIA